MVAMHAATAVGSILLNRCTGNPVTTRTSTGNITLRWYPISVDDRTDRFVVKVKPRWSGLRVQGAEDEKGAVGSLPPILHLGNAYEQCSTPTINKRALAAHGASLADAVKQVVYVTDVRYQSGVAKCRGEAYGDGPIPANTFLVISGLAVPGMLLEIDVTAVAGNK
jgi:2-iminobutanoate/2-iminopropanoate deaminase